MELDAVNDFSQKEVKKILSYISNNHCPYCSSNLHYDDQPDSLYISCNKNFDHFRVSGFKDLETGELVLLYFNDKSEGIMNETILKDFQNIIRRNYYKLD